MNLRQLLELQIIVLALGEKVPSPWWRCNFLSQEGLSTLEFLYPRSYFAGAVHSASRAARAIHDSVIGVGDALHLFRLPQQVHRGLDQLLQDTEVEARGRFMPIVDDREALLTELNRLLGDTPTELLRERAPAGPLRVGDLALARDGALVARLAAPYLVAFQTDVKVYPYLADQGVRS
jgi:hypothetical protein